MSKQAGRLYNARPGEASDEATAARRSSGVSHRGRRSRSVVHASRTSCGGAGEGRRAGAALRGRSALAEAAAQQMDSRPDHRRVGRCAGPRLDHPSRRLARAGRGARHDQSADRAVLRARPADSRVRRRRQSRRPLGRSRARATTGRTRITASRSTTKATSGLAATAAALRQAQGRRRPGRARAAGRRTEPPAGRKPGRRRAVVQRQHGLEVHARRQVPDADREAALEQRQQRPRQPPAAGEDLPRQRDQRAVRRRRLRQSPRHRVRRGHAASTSGTGARTATSPTMSISDGTIRRRRPRSSSGTPCTARTCQSIASCTSATASTIGFRCSSPMARS